MSVFFERGPQKEETQRFMLTPDKKVHEIDETFKRISGFYFDRGTRIWQEKLVSLNLGYWSKGQFTSSGVITFNVGPEVDQGEKY